ncbi:MAG: FtsX-like permease family protein [Flavobacteriales bacterium]|nr:FtsX-like permease family protein [Flavobacteriales bacterium]MBK7246340.1 FtsX-like permease family protein [Flavobacteriales bacterium]MBK9059887.1 FtsX-like permease family protein [Flavobacteriales bacterium]QQS72031.1 MAG: FtsX-like permease family protein [Flavobacteriales bacterium]HQV38771.1 FtsX-like permease family protein [Flavobacteriales bacterium]
MNLPLLFARRYLLAKRGRNAINIITLISIVVVAVVTAAMVVVLSTLNGISLLVDTLYSPFDQDITISAAVGKTFQRDSLDLAVIKALPEVQRTSWVIEENVLLRSGGQQTVATMKGVEPQYLEMSRLPTQMYSGDAEFDGVTGPLVILGAALKDGLGVPKDDGVTRPLDVAALVRGRTPGKLSQSSFEQQRVAVAGAFTINLEFDNQYMLAPIGLAAELLHYGDAVNALEIQAVKGTDPERLQRKIEAIAGPRFTVRTRHQKNALMYSTNATEKWFTFIVLAFIGLIGAFNIIASLTLMMIEKRQDMRTLSGMGVTEGFIRRVFFLEGLLIVLVGTVSGLVVGLGLCGLQEWTGMVSLQDSVVESYPVLVMWTDLILIFFAVMAIGTLAAWVPLRSLSRRYLAASQ